MKLHQKENVQYSHIFVVAWVHVYRYHSSFMLSMLYECLYSQYIPSPNILFMLERSAIHCLVSLSQRLPMKTLSLLKGESTSMTKAEEAAENQRRRARKELELFGPEHSRRPGALTANETWWCQHYVWLKNQGYLLRSRYAPDWVPSWEGTERNPFTCEDGRAMRVRDVWSLHHLLADGCIVWSSHERNACI